MNVKNVRSAIRTGSIKALAGERLTGKHAQSDLLERAIRAGKPPIVAALLAAGADVTYCHKRVSPLHVACTEGKAAIVDLLITHGADVHAKDPNEGRPLHAAVSGGPEKARAKIVKSLLAAGAAGCGDLCGKRDRDDVRRVAGHRRIGDVSRSAALRRNGLTPHSVADPALHRWLNLRVARPSRHKFRHGIRCA